MIERKVTFTLQFHALLPDNQTEAEQAADRIRDAIIDTLRSQFVVGFHDLAEVVAAESFEAYGWDDEEVT